MEAFDTNHIDLMEVKSISSDNIVLYCPVAKDKDEHSWKAKLTIDLPKDVAIAAGMPESVFELDEFHQEEYAGKRFSELMELVEHKKKPVLKFNLTF
ncbi:MAG: hypothetical protein ACLFP2_04535 [Candidatus Woesearchaeota archaeon]